MATEDMQFDSEGDQNDSMDSFEKQLQQQEIELRKEQKAQKEAQEALAQAIPTPQQEWMDTQESEQNNDLLNGSSQSEKIEESTPVGTKRSSPEPQSQENGEKGDDEISEPPTKKGKQDEVAKLWAAIESNKEDFVAWTNMLQYVDQQSDLETAREAYPSFFVLYPFCYGYWKKYADLEKRKGTPESVLEVFEAGLAAIPLSVDLWVHYLDYISNTFLKEDEEAFVRSQFERAVSKCGGEYKSDKMWDAYISWEANAKRWCRVTAVYDKVLTSPTFKYASHWTKFQEHVKKHPVTEVISLTEFLAHRRDLKKKETEEEVEGEEEAPPGVEDDGVEVAGGVGTAIETPASTNLEVTEEECKNILQELLSKREKIHTDTSNIVKERLSYEEGIKRPYFHVKPLEKSQLQAWRDYLAFETEKGDESRIRILYERCLIATALYQEFWLKYIEYLESLPTVQPSEMREVFQRCCNVHLKNKMKPQLAWALFEEEQGETESALELLQKVTERHGDALEPWLQRASLERRRGRLEAAEGVFKQAVGYFTDKNAGALTEFHAYLLVKYSRFVAIIMGDYARAVQILSEVVDKKLEESLPASEQKALEVLLWGLCDRHLSCTSPRIQEAMEVLSKGLSENFLPHSRLSFATSRHQLLVEFGGGKMTVRESARNLRILEEELKDVLEDKDKDQGKGKKGAKGADSKQAAQQNGGAYGATGANNPYNSFGAPNQPPPQHPPPPQGGGNYGGYGNQGYQQGGGYPPQQQYPQQGWGYPPQGGNYGYGNQQQWSGYNNYYGGQR